MSIVRSSLAVPSEWGLTLQNESITHRPRPETAVVLLPGDRYGREAPLLYYATQAALQSGCDVLRLEYGHQAARVPLDAGRFDRLCAESEEAVTRFLEAGYRRVVLVSKSLGTLVASRLAPGVGSADVRHVFLTPVPGAIPAMRQARGIAIVGTADPVFPAERLAELGQPAELRVETVGGADHGLMIPGDYAASLAVLGAVCDHCARIFAVG